MLTAKEYAERHNLHLRWVQQKAAQGAIPGARKVLGRWRFPEGPVKSEAPEDAVFRTAIDVLAYAPEGLSTRDLASRVSEALLDPEISPGKVVSALKSSIGLNLVSVTPGGPNKPAIWKLL